MSRVRSAYHRSRPDWQERLEQTSKQLTIEGWLIGFVFLLLGEPTFTLVVAGLLMILVLIWIMLYLYRLGITLRLLFKRTPGSA